jgi:proline iminopeptidase
MKNSKNLILSGVLIRPRPPGLSTGFLQCAIVGKPADMNKSLADVKRPRLYESGNARLETLVTSTLHRKVDHPDSRRHRAILAPAAIIILAAFGFLFAPTRTFAHDEHGVIFNASSGATIYYEVFGSGDGPPLFVANGGPGIDHKYLHVSDVWDTLAHKRKIVMWDQRGTGQSGALEPGETCTLADQINDLDALRAHLGYERIDLLGHSYGGFLAMAYAARFPQHIERLVTLGSPAPKWSDTVLLLHEVFPDVTAQEEANAFTADLNEKDSEAALEANRALNESMLFYAREHRDEFARKMANDQPNYTINRLVNEDLRRFDLNPELAKYRFPVLIACGRFDVNVAPVVAYNTHKAIPGSQFVVFPKSGHMPFFEEPDKFVAVMNAFLSGAPVPDIS